MHSIYHFWKHLIDNKVLFSEISNLSDFNFDKRMLSCANKGIFPDLAIKLNKRRSVFTGGELIELKDSKSYNVASFNSTVPSGKKNIRKIISSERGTIFLQMQSAGDDVFSLEEREVYYLVRGRKKGRQKICLVHGSFFETIAIKELIQKSFSQVLDEKLVGSDIPQDVKDALGSIFSDQETFSKVRSVENASVKLRFRVLTEVKPEGNILNSKMYPEIRDDTINLVVPYQLEEEPADIASKVKLVFGQSDMEQIRVFSIKHPFNGWFVVFQTDL
ncbi:MAG TPA: hypothetical protein VFG81_13075 [Anaerolineales bacterium]|jgi:hypothetical protein|nr:hypothetical protein [Anaerolineales bacterium]